MDRVEGVELLDAETVFQGHYRVERLTLRHRLFAGGWSRPLVRELFRAHNAVVVLPYDPEADQVVLIEEFRVGFYANGETPWPIAVVAGVIEPGEAPETVARREALEEAGCALLGPLERIVDYYTSPGCSSERISAFCGRCRVEGVGGVHGLAAEGEDIRVRVAAFAEMRTLLERGEIQSGPAVIAAQWLVLNRDRLRARWLGP
jgi:ADP-ribose pyrophosphatase